MTGDDETNATACTDLVFSIAGRFRLSPDQARAIANEVGIDSSAIGAIQIADRFSLVEVPDEIADDIVEALRRTTIKGRQVLVRRDRA